MATNKVATALRLPEETLCKITFISKQNHRSFNAQVEHLIERCIAAYEKENGEIPVQPRGY